VRATVAGVLPVREYERFFGRDAVYEVLDGAGGPEADGSRVAGVSCARFVARYVGREAEAEAWAVVADSIVETMPAEEQEGARRTIEVVDGIGDIHLAILAGDPETALRLYEESPVSERPGSDFRRLHGRLLLALDRPEEALEVLVRGRTRRSAGTRRRGRPTSSFSATGSRIFPNSRRGRTPLRRA
jgi:hypothetical protein